MECLSVHMCVYVGLRGATYRPHLSRNSSFNFIHRCVSHISYCFPGLSTLRQCPACVIVWVFLSVGAFGVAANECVSSVFHFRRSWGVERGHGNSQSRLVCRRMCVCVCVGRQGEEESSVVSSVNSVTKGIVSASCIMFGATEKHSTGRYCTVFTMFRICVVETVMLCVTR